MTALAPLSIPIEIEGWMPLTQAAALGLLTFVQEDVPTVSAAVLAAAGKLGWMAGYFGCFFGIWIGDALLYLLARGLGRPLLTSQGRRFFDPAAVARSERWFAERGTWVLLSSRFVPGTRLPTYLAAGFLKLPFARFLLVTGAAVAVWTTGIFLLARSFGPELLDWLGRWNSGGWTLLAVILCGVLTWRLALRIGDQNTRRRIAAAWGRARRWEFWPPWIFYLPVAFHYVRLALRYRGLTVPTAANPGIFSGGFVGESKIATLRDLAATSPEFTAAAWLVEGGSVDDRLAFLDRCGLEFPYILKPDVGQRGVGIKLIRDRAQAADYLAATSAPLIAQHYAAGPEEAGVFYYRLPGEQKGRIFAITEKIFPAITGDGVSSVEELIWRDERARFVAGKYLRRLESRRSDVLASGETLKLVEAGNHAQGCIFRDGARLWSEELERCLDRVSQKLNGFFIGRYDIRYATEDALRAGRDFRIIELNGAASEATSIYDARTSLAQAYRTLFRQWDLVFRIGAANRRAGCAPTRARDLWRAWRQTAALIATYPVAD